MIRRILFVFVLVLSMAPLAALDASPDAAAVPGGAERRKILAVGEGEELMYAENCIMLDSAPEKWRVVTRRSKGPQPEFFIYSAGKRQGPFTALRSDMIPACGGQNPCAAYEPGESGDGEEKNRLVGEDDNGTVINFLGKKYGPFSQILFFEVSPDLKRMFVCAADPENRIWLITSEGRRQAIEGMPEAMVANPGGTLALLRVAGTVNPLLNRDSAALIAGMDKVTYWGSDGRKWGPFAGDSIASDGVWFTKSGDHWLMVVGQQLYIDGAPFRKFPDGLSKCEFWLSSDGRKWARSTYEKLEFFDGSVFPFAFDIGLARGAGASYLTWVSLENGSDLVLYKKAF